jgi:hypothetical protein
MSTLSAGHNNRATVTETVLFNCLQALHILGKSRKIARFSTVAAGHIPGGTFF